MITTDNFIKLLTNQKHPDEIEQVQLEILINQYPFFQSARALHLKQLYKNKSLLYNLALKKAASYTVDRSILFDYITSEEFTQEKTLKEIHRHQDFTDDILIDVDEVIENTNTETAEKSEEINENLKSVNQILSAEKNDEIINDEVNNNQIDESEIDTADLEDINNDIQEPRVFDQSESHTFNDWLQMLSVKPLSALNKNDDEPKETEKDSKLERIDAFLANKPKFEADQNKISHENLSEKNLYSEEALMTETLAQVYIEQKKYKEAKLAFRILSLKIPEKSGYFADQIKKLEKLKK